MAVSVRGSVVGVGVRVGPPGVTVGRKITGDVLVGVGSFGGEVRVRVGRGVVAGDVAVGVGVSTVGVSVGGVTVVGVTIVGVSDVGVSGVGVTVQALG